MKIDIQVLSKWNKFLATCGDLVKWYNLLVELFEYCNTQVNWDKVHAISATLKCISCILISYIILLTKGEYN